jgi:uncharacterized protein (TIGR03083 family)
MVDHTALVAAASENLADLCDAVAGGPLETAVPTCPGFSVDDLAQHVARFCDRWTQVLREGTEPTSRPLAPAVGELDPTARGEWLRAIGADLVAEMRATPPATPRWTWYPPDRTAGFVARRVAHELAVHRVDAQLARGAAEPIDPLLAVDGIEEVFLMQAFRASLVAEPVLLGGRTIHLHGTDPDVPGAEWLIRIESDGPGGVEVSREHAKGDLAVRASAGDLELLLYQRPPVGSVETFGDESVLADFHRTFTF